MSVLHKKLYGSLDEDEIHSYYAVPKTVQTDLSQNIVKS
jgi:hypothetical protein